MLTIISLYLAIICILYVIIQILNTEKKERGKEGGKRGRKTGGGGAEPRWRSESNDSPKLLEKLLWIYLGGESDQTLEV